MELNKIPRKKGRKKLPVGMKKVQVEFYIYQHLIDRKGHDELVDLMNHKINSNENNILELQ